MAVALLPGCALNQKGYAGDWRDVKAAPLESVHPEAVSEAPTAQSSFDSRMLATMDRLDKNVTRLGDLLERKDAPVPAKKAQKPVSGIFSRNAEKQPAVAATSPKITVKKTQVTKKVTRTEFRRLEAKVDQLSKTAVIHAVALREKSDKYVIFRIHNFAKGESSLKHDNMEKQINKLILFVDENNLKYTEAIGYTNADGDEKNLILSVQRAKAVLDHMTMYRPDNIKGIKPKGGGETEDFGVTEENRCVILICEKKPKTP